MTTRAEIIKTLEKHSPDETSELGEAIVLAIEMLKKEASRGEVYYGVKLCPTCSERATFQTWEHGYPVVNKMNYCQACGQKLDWSEI